MEKIEALKIEFLNSWGKRIDRLLSLCESPIEKIFLMGLIEYYNRDIGNCRIEFLAREADMECDEEGYPTKILEIVDFESLGLFYTLIGLRLGWEDERYEIFPQYRIQHFRDYEYRVDFAVFAYNKRSRDKGINQYVVECDGYDYHYKNVDLVNKDHLRANNLMRDGWKVIRFTGNALNNDLNQCIKSFHQCCIAPKAEFDTVAYCESEFEMQRTSEDFKERIRASY